MEKGIPKIKIIKTFYEYGKIDHIFHIVKDEIVKIRAFSYDGVESEVDKANLHKWSYDPVSEICYINKGIDD